ncbi:unnamed protein product, partial [Iphiclides podalirius]
MRQQSAALAKDIAWRKATGEHNALAKTGGLRNGILTCPAAPLSSNQAVLATPRDDTVMAGGTGPNHCDAKATVWHASHSKHTI